MKKLLSIFVMVLFVGALVAQQTPQKKEQTKPCDKAKTECCKDKEKKGDKTCCNKSKDKACCSKTKTDCKGTKKDSTTCSKK